MAFIGKKPAAAPLTSSDVADGIISTAKIADTAITNAKLAQDIISADTALGATPADTDEFLVSDAGVLKRMDYSHIKGGGITEIDLWRLTTAFNSGSWTIDANLERCDNAGFGHLGTGMSQSSGVFTFPSTGFWWVWYTQNVTANGDNRAVYARIATTHDNSTYINASLSVGEIARVEDNFTGNSLTCNTILDVTDTANVKCKFTGSISNTGVTVWGNTAQNETYMTFIRLGDT